MKIYDTFFGKLPERLQGYICVIATMLVWGGFSLMSRLNVNWGITAWDVIALRFGISASILLPIVFLQNNWRYLFGIKPVLLAIFGGVGYSSLVYSAFLLAPVVHGAVFLNGMIPVTTALLLWFALKIRPDKNTKIALIIIGLTLASMLVLMIKGGMHFGTGDLLFLLCAVCWSIYGLMIKEWGFSPWQIMCSTAIWSAIIYLPIYWLFLPSSLTDTNPWHIAYQAIFHSIFVMIFATVTYSLAVARLGAFFAGALACLAPFLSAIIAVPLLGEPINHVMLVGLVGMCLGTLQPWRFLKN